MGFGKNSFHRKIMPNTCSSYSGHKNKNIFAEEVILFRMFYFVGLVFPVDLKWTFSKALLHKLLEHGATLFLIIHTAGDFYSLFKLISKLPIGLTCTSLFSNIFSISLRLTLLQKRRAILSLMNHLQNVDSNSLFNKRVSRRGPIIAGICTCYIFPGFIMWFVISLCYQESKKVTFYMEDAFFGWSSSKDWANCIILITLDHLIQNQQHILSGFLIILIWYSLGLVKRNVGSFTTEAQRTNDVEVLFKSYLLYSSNVFECMCLMEQAFSLLLLLVFAFVLFSMFNVTTFLMTVTFANVPISLLIGQVVLLCVTMTGFYVASFQAVAVHDAAIEVRNSIHKVVSKSDSADYKTKCLLLAMASNFPSKVVVTGWGLFALKRGFLKKTTSGIVTYAVLLSQLGKQAAPK
ncbi:uncharacterized protein CDAR_165231 [Caerostris darwini]|uniref:Odorant receptor n=1 Tax=Caerostris darwini TaxID=1538125 RepID=A0AAV4NWJ2_9ARAC|nr:uncharacterized protein CDAR_165231 [Caerostris darwini]